ncbi:arginase family protein [Microvirga tunisiensis]|nr:arginase family protein [Microvirga tunisiensis]
MGLPACSNLSRPEADAVLVGVPAATPYASVGSYCADAPDAIRAVMPSMRPPFITMTSILMARCFHHGCVSWTLETCPLAEDASENRAQIREAVGAILNAGAVPLVLGGDDSVPIPLFEAFAGRGSYTVLQIDAHIDWRDDVDGERLGLSSTMRRASEMGHIGRIIQVGQRGVGSARPADLADAKAAGVHFISAHQLHREGLEPVLRLIEPGSELLITFDCDALDPAIMPAVIGRVPGGLSYWQAVDLLHGAADWARVASFDLVEFMPARDLDGTGALVAGRILATVTGIVARQAGSAAESLPDPSDPSLGA